VEGVEGRRRETGREGIGKVPFEQIVRFRGGDAVHGHIVGGQYAGGQGKDGGNRLKSPVQQGIGDLGQRPKAFALSLAKLLGLDTPLAGSQLHEVVRWGRADGVDLEIHRNVKTVARAQQELLEG
jgi:hypothetical protein